MALLQDLTVFGATRLVLDTIAANIYSDGFHHNTHNNDDSVLLAGGGYKALADFAMDTTVSNTYVKKAGDTMTGHLTIAGQSLYFGKTGSNAILNYGSGYPNYGIWYHDESVDKMTFSASGNANVVANADFAINGAGDGTLTCRGNLIAHAGNITNPVTNITTTEQTIATIAGVNIKAKITVTNSAPTLGTSATTIATIGGTTISAKVDHVKTSITANTGGIGGEINTNGSSITLPVIKVNANGHVSGWSTRSHDINNVKYYVKIDIDPRNGLVPNSWYIMGTMTIPLDRITIEGLIRMTGSTLFYVDLVYNSTGIYNFLENQYSKFMATIKLKDTTNALYPNETLDLSSIDPNNLTPWLDYLTIEGSSGIFDGLCLLRAEDERELIIYLCIHTKNYNSNIKVDNGTIYIPGQGVHGNNNLNFPGIYWSDTLRKVTDTSGMINSIKISDIYENTSSTTNGYYAWDEICSPKNYSTFYYADATYRTNDYLLNANGGVVQLSNLSSSHNHDSVYVKKIGDTMTGTLTFNVGAAGYSDSYSSKGINMGNANITGVNSIYTADASDNAQEGFHFYRDTTHVDTIYAKAGVLYFVPNRQLTTNGTSYTVLHTGNYTTTMDARYVKLDAGAAEQTIKSSIGSLSEGVIDLWRNSGDHYTFLGFSNGATKTYLGGIGFKSQSDHNLYRKDGTNYYQIADANNIVDSTANTLGTSDTTIATIAGVNITAKVDHVRTTITAGTAGTSSATSGLSISIPYVTMNVYGHVTAYGTHTHTISFSDFPTMYWANVQVSNASSDSTEPTFAKARIKTDEYIGTASGSQCHVTFNTTNKCLDFIFD